MLFCQKKGIGVQKLDFINSLSLWPNIVPNTISLMLTTKYPKISINTMRRIQVFIGLLFIQNKKKNQYFINIMTCIFLSDGQGKEKFCKNDHPLYN